MLLLAATNTDNTSIPQWQCNTNPDPFIRRHKDWLLQHCPIWHHHMQYRPNEFRIFWMHYAVAPLVLRIPKFALVSTLIRDNLHWLLAVQRIKFKILQLVANCIHHRAPLYFQELCGLVSAVPRGASTLAIRRPILSSGQSLSIIIDAGAGIRCGRTVGVEWFACSCMCLHSQEQ